MPALFAFLHHIAAFALVAALAVEFVLLRDALTPAIVRKLSRADAAFGAAAGALLVIGLLRVFYFEKGAWYYFHNIAFMVKFSLFVLIGLLSIHPTLRIVAWNRAADRGEVQAVPVQQLRSVRAAVHAEMATVVLLILCAALMARGIGMLG